ncbi:VOC family protein [Alkalimonas sp.]|uniref:VOC family protein n=1 Tax=Alkalimonas sp. TaxID=1872453 RepID=UPI00263A8DC4|nr:VOC family protein [Alkalimonas sp.]MCC5825056.1 VOC family protein [Alkalimonas sp.]
MTFKIAAFQEAIAIVNDFGPLITLLCEHGGWQEIHRGPLSSSLLQAWQLSTETEAAEVVLANPGINSGYLRLIRFTHLSQTVMRANDQSWDYGGTFDFNLRIASMDALQPKLSKLGWRGASEPVEFFLGSSRVKEWLAVNQNHVRFAFIERVSPPLHGWEHMQPISQIFNSSQIVQDFTKSMAFYQDVLGFQCVVQSGNLTEQPGANVLGIPFERAHTEPYQLAILQPDGEMRGSIELVCFAASKGKDYSQDNTPPNLGMLGVRFPVEGIVELAAHLQTHQVPLPVPLTELDLPPYGRVQLLAAKTPDGAWLEFYQPCI